MIEEKEIPETNLAIMPQASMVRSIEETVAEAKRYVAALTEIRNLVVSVTNAMDWSNQGDKPYLEKSGCDKVYSTFGVKMESPEFTKETLSDDKGDFVIWSCSLTGTWNNVTVSEIGTCSSRDDFFGTMKKESGKVFKPLSEVDQTDIKKKSFTNGANRLIKKLLGISYTWEELKELSNGKITKESVKTVDFGKGTKGGNIDSPETKQKRNEIRTMLLQLTNNDENNAAHILEEMTTFTGSNGTVKGKRNVSYLSEKQIPIVHGQLKKKIAEINKELDKQAATESGDYQNA